MISYLEIKENIENYGDRALYNWLRDNIGTLKKVFDITNKELSEDYQLFDYGIDICCQAYESIYGLFNRLEPNPKNAQLIHYIFSQLPAELFDELNSHSMISISDIPKLLEKWKNKDNVTHEDYLYYYELDRSYDPLSDAKFKRIYKKCTIERDYIYCRFYLACLYYGYSGELDKFGNSNDLALRMAYYRVQNFNYDKEHHLTPDKLNAYYNKDKQLYFDYLVENMSIYHRREHQKLIILSADNIDRTDQFVKNLNKFKTSNKRPWEIAEDIFDRIEEEERQEIEAQEEMIRKKNLEDNIVKTQRLITSLKETIIISFTLMFVGLATLIWLIA